MSKDKNSTSEITKSSDLKSEPIGRIPCVLVYPDRRHVSYVNNITNCIEELLPEMGFRVRKLGGETRPDEHFGENFERLAEECAFGIIILDGLRPNVLYEYGLLRGRGTVILPLQDKKAFIAVKSLYSISDFSNENEVKNKTGLTIAQFHHLKEPSIEYFAQLSDRHGIKSVAIDCDADLTCPEHPKNRIRSEINGLMPKILQKYTEQSLKPVAQIAKHLKEFEELTLLILRYYTNAAPFDAEDVEKASKQVMELEKASNATLPSTIYGTLAALNEHLAQESYPSNPSEGTKQYKKAIEIYKKILETETDSLQRAMTQNNLGAAYERLSGIRDPEANLKLSIKAYKEALTIYKKKDFPTDYAMTQSNLGAAYGEFSGIRDPEANLKLSIKALREALTIRTREDFPIEYARTQNNLGASYQRLSGIRDPEANLKLSIKAYKEALTIYKKKDFPTDYATTQNNLGAAYEWLSEIRDPEANLKLSIKAYEEALTIRTREDFPTDYAMTQSNLGAAYGEFSGIRDPEANLKLSIKALREALTIRTREDFPTDYATTQNNLGAAYERLSEIRDPEANLKLSIKALREALTIHTRENFPIKYAMTQYNVGLTYRRLSEIRDPEANLKLSIKAYKEALTIYKKKDFPINYATTQNSLKNARARYSKLRRSNN
jgi:tetratricopeptide (TPR) repeat protein